MDKSITIKENSVIYLRNIPKAVGIITVDILFVIFVFPFFWDLPTSNYHIVIILILTGLGIIAVLLLIPATLIFIDECFGKHEIIYRDGSVIMESWSC